DADVTRGFLHSHSYTGNPLACRAALATLQIFDDDAVIATNRQRGDRIEAALQPLRDDARVAHFRRRGMIFAFDAVIDDAEQAATFSRRFFSAALEHELLLRPIGRTVYLMPPYILDDGEIAHLASSVQAV